MFSRYKEDGRDEKTCRKNPIHLRSEEKSLAIGPLWIQNKANTVLTRQLLL